jgi:probable FeS assembly SUF system protein SufT
MRTRMQEPVVLSRDCSAVHIPSGETGTLPEGTLVTITQDLGGSFTVHAGGNLYRIAGADADALGREPLPQPILPDDASDEDVAALVWAQMETCYDPEIPINLVELGLIYDCRITKVGDNQRRVDVEMTLTAPGCGMGDVIADDVRSKILLVPTIVEANVEVVFEPPWTMDRMSDAARLAAGLM